MNAFERILYDDNENEHEYNEEFDEDAPPPPPVDFGDDLNSDQLEDRNHFLNSHQESVNSQYDDQELWERHYSEEDGEYYLYNPLTQECIWESEDNFLEQWNDNMRNYEEHRLQSDENAIDESEYTLDLLEKLMLEDKVATQSSFSENSSSTQQQYQSNKPSLRSGMNDASLSVVDRSNIMLQSKQTKVDKLNQQKLEDELKACKPQPEINKKSKMMNRSVNDMLEWDEKRKQKIQEKADALGKSKNSELTGRPIITKKAEDLARRWKEEDESQNWDNDGVSTSFTATTSGKSVQERLYEYNERKKMKQQYLIEQENLRARREARPQLAPHSAKYIRRDDRGSDIQSQNGSANSVSVSDRLYALAQLQNRTNRGNDALTNGKLTSHDEETGQRLFEVSSNRS
jgi:uncharacterized protein YdaT